MRAPRQDPRDGSSSASRLLAPDLRGRVVERPRLFARLAAGVEQSVTLVAAPAGSGKTMLLASWLAASAPTMPVAWLSLDPGDDSPERFWRHVVEALDRVGALPTAPDLTDAADDGISSTVLAARVLDAVDRSGSSVVLVLDDVHELTGRAVLDGLDFLVRHCPPTLRLVLLTRADPPLSLHRLVLTGSLSELRAADLAFTLAEAAEMLADYGYRDRLTDTDVVLLHRRTEGWAAGLRLAAVSMQGHPDPHRFVLELAGDDRALAGYLVSEVLDRQTPALRTFMLRTCVVDELSGALADALTDGDDGERTLARMVTANAFVVASGGRRGWYRYHPLFGELLRSELRRELPAEVADLRRRAAQWYAEQGMPREAVEQTILAGDWSTTSELVAEHGLRFAVRAAWPDLRELVDRVPADVLSTDPELALLAAAERLGSGREDAPSDLELALEQEQLLRAHQRRRAGRVLAVCRLARAARRSDLDEMAAAADAVLAVPVAPDDRRTSGSATRGARAVALLGRGVARLWTGDVSGAEPDLRAAAAAARWCGLPVVHRDALGHLALLHALTGRLSAAAELAAGALELDLPDAPSTPPLLALAHVHLERDQLPAAVEQLDRARPGRVGPGRRPLAVLAAVVESRVRRAGGDMTGAFGALRGAGQLGVGWRAPAALRGALVAAEVDLRLAVGDLPAARARLRPNPDGPARTPVERLAFAALLHAEGDAVGAAASAAALLDRSHPDLDGGGARAWLVRALAEHALGRTEAAARSLARAIDLAEPEDDRRPFLDAGPAGRSLLVHYRAWVDTSWAFLDDLVQATLDSVHAVAPSAAVVEPLSQREREVLGYLSSMLTFTEIGSELYISVNTTKSHVRSIYRKLGVVGRRDAVRRARQLHLLHT